MRESRDWPAARAAAQPVLADATWWELVPCNLAALARGPRVERPEATPMTIAQAGQFLGRRALAPLLGLPRGEIIGVRWADADLDAGALMVRQTPNCAPSARCC